VSARYIESEAGCNPDGQDHDVTSGVRPACFCGLPVEAANFSTKRSINLDIWTAWPGEERWDDPDLIPPYPEWRKTVGALERHALLSRRAD